MALYNCSGNNSTCGNVGGTSDNTNSCNCNQNLCGTVGGISNNNCSWGNVGGVSNNNSCPYGNVGGVSNNSSCPYGNVGGISNSNCSLSCTDWLLIFIALILLLVVFLG